MDWSAERSVHLSARSFEKRSIYTILVQILSIAMGDNRNFPPEIDKAVADLESWKKRALVHRRAKKEQVHRFNHFGLHAKARIWP